MNDKTIFSRNLNYEKVFQNLVISLQDYAAQRRVKTNVLNNEYIQLENYKNILLHETPTKQFIDIQNTKAILGVSGGMDSTIVTLIASLAFSEKNLYTISLPTSYNSNETKNAARKLAFLLGNNFEEIPILIENEDTENTQALRRALVLQKTRDILISKHKNFLSLILNTSNLSEIKLANYTINGDTIGDIGCLKTLYKSEIYQLIDWIVSIEGVSYMKKEYSQIKNWDEIMNCLKAVAEIRPSAELKNNQTDSDVLLKGDYYYLLADMVLIAKEYQFNDEEIETKIVMEKNFINWSKAFFQGVDFRKVAKYTIDKINFRTKLHEYKMNLNNY